MDNKLATKKKPKKEQENQLNVHELTSLSAISHSPIDLAVSFDRIIATKRKNPHSENTVENFKHSRRQRQKLSEKKRKNDLGKDQELDKKKPWKWNDDCERIDRFGMYYGETNVKFKTNEPLLALPKTCMRIMYTITQI